MAATRVQTKTFTSVSYASSAAGVWTSNTTTGNTIIVAIVYNNDTAGSITGITDSQSNTYTQIAGASGVNGDTNVETWYAYNITGGATPTVTISFVNFHDIAVVMREYGGLLTTNPLDVTAEGTTSSGTSHTSATTGTTAQANELVIGVLGVQNNNTYTAGAGYGNVAKQNGTDIYEAIGIEDKDVTSTGTQQATFTVGSASTGYFAVLTFKEVAAGSSSESPSVSPSSSRSPSLSPSASASPSASVSPSKSPSSSLSPSSSVSPSQSPSTSPSSSISPSISPSASASPSSSESPSTSPSESLPPEFAVLIDGVNRTADILTNTLVIDDVINDKVNTCKFKMIDLSNNGTPSTDQEIIVSIDDERIFAGYVMSLDMTGAKQMGKVITSVYCIDYVRLLDRNLVHKSYEDMTDKAIIEDIVATYCGGFGITTTNVVEGVTIEEISFNYVQPSQAIRKICDLTGRNWFIDYDKDIHYFPLTTTTAPFNIDVNSNEERSFRISKDASQLKNRVYVRGGTKLSDPTTYSEKGDGEKIKFVIPDKPHDVSLTINGTPVTVGIKNIDTSGFDWYLNFQEKYIEQDSGGAVLTASDVLELTYRYDVPILVAVEDSASIEESGVKEFAIFDNAIKTTQSARDRASAELTDYANSIVEASFETDTGGFTSGQYVNVNLSDYGVNDNYIVQKVRLESRGAGYFTYTISLASSKTMGIIRFLIELLEANRNLVELSSDEVIDELFEVSDLLLSDSITELLTIDSAGQYRTWCADSLESTVTRAVWDLFQWGS